MTNYSFELARPEHARAICHIHAESALDLANKLGEGRWGGGQLASIRERIALADPDSLRRRTLYVAIAGGEVIGSVGVGTAAPSFWRKSYWREPESAGLGVTGIVVLPRLQRRGLGRFLMESTEKLADRHAIRFVRLDAYSNNPISNAFYLAIGYELRAKIDLRGTGLNLYEKPSRLISQAPRDSHLES